MEHVSIMVAIILSYLHHLGNILSRTIQGLQQEGELLTGRRCMNLFSYPVSRLAMGFIGQSLMKLRRSNMKPIHYNWITVSFAQ